MMCLDVRSISARSSTRAAAETDAVDDFDERRVAAMAGHALRARLDAIERGQVAREIDRTDVLVEDDESAGAEHAADLGHGVEIDRRSRAARPSADRPRRRRSARPEGVPSRMPPQTSSMRVRRVMPIGIFDETDVLQRALHGHHLGARAVGGADLGEPLAAVD